MSSLTSPWRKSSFSFSNGNCAEVATGKWRKSSFSSYNGNCAEVANGQWAKSSHSQETNCVEWRSSSRCASNECIEVTRGVLVRDSKLGDGSPILRFSPGAWAEFLSTLR